MNVLAAIIQDEMDARGWTQDDVAQRMGPEIGPGENEILIGLCLYIDEARLDAGTAAKLGLAFGMSAQYFLNLDAQSRGGTP